MSGANASPTRSASAIARSLKEGAAINKMIRDVMAAVAFLTRVPVSPEPAFSVEDVGRATRWFPLIGIGLGTIYLCVIYLATPLPPFVIALLVILVEAVLTGALHLDGLADMADGFGGGRTREDVLRIMRDHAIGTYGAISLFLILGLKAALIAALIEGAGPPEYFVLAPAMARWAAVLMSVLQPYARDVGASQHVGLTELFIATAVVAVPMVYSGFRSILLAIAAVAITVCLSVYCKRRIGGITGDTIGATISIVEVAILLLAVAWSRS